MEWPAKGVQAGYVRVLICTDSEPLTEEGTDDISDITVTVGALLGLPKPEVPIFVLHRLVNL